jgi:hypothetical protein
MKVNTVTVQDFAAKHDLDELELRIMLEEAGVENADEVQTLTPQQVQVIESSLNAALQDKPNPYQLSAAPKTKSGSLAQSKTAIALQKQREEAQNLSTAVFQVVQELGIRNRLVAGAKQAEVEQMAYEFGRAKALEQSALAMLADLQIEAAQLESFDPAAILKEMGTQSPNELAANLAQESAAVLQQLRNLSAQYGYK